MSDKFLSEKIKKVSPSEVSPDRYSYFKPGEVEPDLGVPLVDNGISTSLSDGTREWSYLSSGLDIANNNITVDVNTVEIDSENLNYADSNTLFQAITEIDQNVYDDVQRRLIIVSTDATLTGDGTANNVLGVNADNILDIIGESVTQEYINNLDIDAATLEGANGSFYLDWDNTTNKPSPTIEISLTGDVTGYANTTLTELSNGVITIDTTVSANSIELGVDTYGDYIQSIEAGTGVYISGDSVLTISIGQDVAPVSNVTFNDAEFTGDVIIGGNLTISGNAVSIQATTLSITDNMIYLNANSTITNPDIGFAANYNDGTYAHTGLFRDASDGIYKFFDSYTPEPNINPYINTGDASFRLAEVSARRFYGPLTGNVTGNVTGEAGTVNSIANFSTSDLVEGSRLYYTPARVNTAIDTRVTKSFIDNLNVDADTLDNLDSTYYLNYNNLTNRPVIGDGLLTITTADGLSGSTTFTANQVGPSTISLTNTDRGSSQNIFKTILVSGQPTIVAATNTDSLEFVAGSNVSLTTDAITKKIVINSTAASEDNYVDSISFDEDTGSLTLGRTGTLPDLVVTIAALSANSTLEYTYSLTGADAPEGAYINLIGSDSTTDTIYLKEAGATTISWNDVSQTVTISSVDTTYQAGNGLNLTGTTFSHADTSSASNISAVTGTFVSSLSFDTYGHVTGYTTAAESDNYVDSATFNSDTAVLTLGRTGTLPDITVELSGLKFEEVDTLDTVVARGNSTANNIFVGGIVSSGDISAPTFIGNLNGQISDISNFDTDDLAEGTNNLYFTPERANTYINSTITKEFIDNLGVDAETLSDQIPSYYLDYDNFTNTPNSILDFGITDGNSGDALITDGNGNFSFGDITTALDYENVANNLFYITGTQPVAPYNKQLWFDYTTGYLYFYDTVNGAPQWRQTEITAVETFYADISNTAPEFINSGHVWYDTTDGTLSIYTGDEWVVTSGPAGPQGPLGPQGDIGPQGDPGLQGDAGEPGLDGVDGTVAEVANTAPTPGTIGQIWYDVNDGTISVYSGAEWIVTSGPAGPQGPSGPQGDIGPQGDPGPAGDAGAVGADGVDGTVAEVANTAPTPAEIGQIWYDVNDGTISVYSGAEWVVTSGPAGPVGPAGNDGFLIWSKKTTNYTASTNEGIIADTSAGSFTITLPSSPSVGDIVVVGDGSDFTNNSVFVLPGSTNTIEGLTGSFEIDVGQLRVDFIYDGITWQVFSNSGPQGPVGPEGPQGINGTVAEVANTSPSPASIGQLWFDTEDATVSVYNGNDWIVTSGPAGPKGVPGADGYLTWLVATSGMTAQTNQGIIADTTSGTFSIQLPSSPSVGDIVVIADGNDWSINNLTITAVETIENSVDDILMDVAKIRVDFIYNGSTWKIYTNQGPQGPVGATGPAAPTPYALTLIFS